MCARFYYPRYFSPRGVTWLGLVANLVLAAGKIVVGVVFISQTILADGVHSLTDLVSDLAVLIGLRYGDKPADRSHPYGHRRVHTMVALFVGLALLVAAGQIGYRAIRSLQVYQSPIRGPVPLILALVTVPVKELLYQWTRRVGLRVQNPAILANAWHHRTDAFTSIVAAAGIAGAMFAGSGWEMLDALTAIVLAAFLLIAAGKLMVSCGAELIDRAPGALQMSHIANIVLQTSGVNRYHAIRARQLGGKVEMDLHVLVDPDLTVHQGHEIARNVRRRIRQADPTVQEVIVHIEPDE